VWSRGFQPPTMIQKYTVETNSEIWLKDYGLALRAGGADNDLFIIRQLLLYLDSLAQLWLRHLPANSIKRWSDLQDVFVGNF